jgi:hypothetical protein
VKEEKRQERVEMRREQRRKERCKFKFERAKYEKTEVRGEEKDESGEALYYHESY